MMVNGTQRDKDRMTKRDGNAESSVHFSSVQVDSDTKRKQLKRSGTIKKNKIEKNPIQ
jgi:hypothetical protein